MEDLEDGLNSVDGSVSEVECWCVIGVDGRVVGVEEEGEEEREEEEEEGICF